MVEKLLKSVRQLKNYQYILFIILILAFLLRFLGLGYSNFYGDETKTFYLDKTIPAAKFFLDQRKGPVQFAVVWVVESLTQGFNALLVRAPFAFAGSLSVLVFFLVAQKIAGRKAALLSTGLYAFNGFYIAFSRTAQYQSFMLLFGLLAIYFALLYQEAENISQKHYAALSAFFLALAYLSHYDAIFFDIAIAFILIKKMLDHKNNLKRVVKELAIYYVTPFVVTAGLFYVPYVIYGYYYSNTFNYVSRRLTGFEFGKNASWYTFWVYNPHWIWAFLTVFIIPYLLKRADWKRNLLLFWFLVPFTAFEFVFSNPGTHIHNYFLPLLLIVGVGMADFSEILEKSKYRVYFYAFLLYTFGAIFVTDLFVYIPGINSGYPWKSSKMGFSRVTRINKDFQLFLYGFPYNRGWEQIAEYVRERGGVRKIYTNDNDTVAEYYLKGISYAKPGVNYLPEYYIYVFDNQEFTEMPADMQLELDDRTLGDVYAVEKEFYVDGVRTAIFYKLK